MSALDSLNWEDVRAHYDQRVTIHKRLRRFYTSKQFEEFVKLLLGISARSGNYSADDHNLGTKILSKNQNPINQVVSLAGEFIKAKDGHVVPELIRAFNIRYLKIGVGSEASCMVNPSVCWVANTRTIWTHLVLKHGGNFKIADEELRLYREQDSTSEMAYKIWTDIHKELATSMMKIAQEGDRLAKAVSVEPGPVRYIWADAIANALYSSYYE